MTHRYHRTVVWMKHTHPDKPSTDAVISDLCLLIPVQIAVVHPVLTAQAVAVHRPGLHLNPEGEDKIGDAGDITEDTAGAAQALEEVSRLAYLD